MPPLMAGVVAVGEKTTRTIETSTSEGDAPKVAVEPPPDTVPSNVEGRELAAPVDGFGRLWRKTYRVRLTGANVTPEQAIAAWREHFAEFWPPGNRFYAPVTGLKPGEVALVNLELPGGATLSTGVAMTHADPRSFVLTTPQGHMFAGRITFSAREDAGVTVAQAVTVMRASDPLYEFGMEVIGHRRENAFWIKTLEALAAYFGARAPVETQVECLDFRRRWLKAGNIWYNAAIRTAIHQAAASLRRLAHHH
jgi:hypothetical protein